MTYSSGGLIQAADYNGFVSTNVGANVNATLEHTAYGQTAIATVSTAGTITATQWASLVNSTASMARIKHRNHCKISTYHRQQPSTCWLLSTLISPTAYTNRYNAVAVGSQFTGLDWNQFKNQSDWIIRAGVWTITFTNTITWASAAAANYFFNAGGLIKIDVAKSSTGLTGDPEWNDLANTLCGDIYVSGLAAAHTIAGVSYTGVPPKLAEQARPTPH
jgi:hypothetical protein